MSDASQHGYIPPEKRDDDLLALMPAIGEMSEETSVCISATMVVAYMMSGSQTMLNDISRSLEELMTNFPQYNGSWDAASKTLFRIVLAESIKREKK